MHDVQWLTHDARKESSSLMSLWTISTNFMLIKNTFELKILMEICKNLSLSKWPSSIVPGNGQFIFFFRSKLFTWIISIITVKKYYYCLPSSSSSLSSSWDLPISWDTLKCKTMRIKWWRNIFSYWPQKMRK